MAQEKNQWGSNLSFILAMIGSAVGLGNIWRYPYVLYVNGGGAFYIPYIVAILLLGLPFLILEYGVGYDFKSSFPKALKSINRKWEFLGWFLPLCVFIIMVYYSTILGWDIIYMVLSFFKGWGADPNAYFTNTVLHATDSPMGILNFVPLVAIAMLVGWVIIWFISHRDLEDGLGRMSKVLVPLLFVIMIIVVGSSLLLPGAYIGLAELFRPDWYTLLDFEIWLGAFGQIVFSLSLGMSIAFTYASYTRDDTDLITNTFTVAFANCLFENFAALGVFSILGYMSLQSGVPVEELVEQGAGLLFVVYPTIFNVFEGWASLLGPLFFIAIFIAGLTSIVSTLEPLSFSVQNKFDLSRSRTMTILCIIGAAISMIFATGYGEILIDTVDTFINQLAIMAGVVLECILFAWVFKAEKLVDSLNRRSKTFKVGRKWLLIVKYIAPIFITVIWIGGMIDIFSEEAFGQIAFTLLVAVALIIATIVLTRRPATNPEWDEIHERD